MTNLLTFDTATAVCSVALWRDGEICGHATRLLGRGHAEALFPMVGEVLTAAGTGYHELDGLAVTVGPGSFTGIRIGLSAARGIALATGISAWGVTTTELAAHCVPPSQRENAKILVVYDSKRLDPYFALYDSNLRPLEGPAALHPDQIAQILSQRPARYVVIGDGAEQLRAALAAADCAAQFLTDLPMPDARDLANLAATRWPPHDDALPLEPLYIRPPDTTGPGGKTDAPANKAS